MQGIDETNKSIPYSEGDIACSKKRPRTDWFAPSSDCYF